MKICDKGTLKGKDKDGKDVTKDVENCMTLTEQIDGHRSDDGLGTLVQQDRRQGEARTADHRPARRCCRTALRVTVFPKDLWDKVQKNEKIDKADDEPSSRVWPWATRYVIWRVAQQR